MKTIDIAEELKSNSYPGRGIIIGKSADGKYAVTAYFHVHARPFCRRFGHLLEFQ